MRGFAAEVLSFDLFHSLFHYSLKKKKVIVFDILYERPT